MKGKISGAIPVILVFIILNALFIAGRSALEKWGADQTVLILGNTFIFLITLVSFFIAKRGLKNPNPNVFMRSVMGSIMIKMLLVVILASLPGVWWFWRQPPAPDFRDAQSVPVEEPAAPRPGQTRQQSRAERRRAERR